MEHQLRHGLRSYLIGFVLAVILTAIPFYAGHHPRPAARAHACW